MYMLTRAMLTTENVQCEIMHTRAMLNSRLIVVSLNLFFQKGFVEAHADDGLLEIFGLKQGWHASFVMVELISAKHIAQVQQHCIFMLLAQIFIVHAKIRILRILVTAAGCY